MELAPAAVGIIRYIGAGEMRRVRFMTVSPGRKIIRFDTTLMDIVFIQPYTLQEGKCLSDEMEI